MLRTPLHPTESARTHQLLRRMPRWINVTPDSRLFKLINTVTMETDLSSKQITQFRDNMNIIHMDVHMPTNLLRFENLPAGNHGYYGHKDSKKIPLTQVSTETELLDNLPTRITRSSLFAPASMPLLLSLRYMENISDGIYSGFAAVSAQHPADDSAGLFIIDSSGNIIEQSAQGILTQSYDEIGTDEEVIFINGSTTLNNIPLNDSLKVYDIINLTDSLPTEVTTFTRSGNVLTWTGGSNPDARYIAEYDYAVYNSIRALIPDFYQWDIAKRRELFDYSLQFLSQNAYSYTPSYSTDSNTSTDHIISASTSKHELSMLGLSERDGSTYVKLNPQEVRAGRTVDISLTGSKLLPDVGSTEEWVLNAQGDNNYTKDMKAHDAAFINTSVRSVQVYDSSDNDVTRDFIASVDMLTGIVTIYANDSYASQTLHISINYRALISGTATVTNHESDFITIDGINVYLCEVDISGVTNQSFIKPGLGDLQLFCDREFTAMIESDMRMGFESAEDAVTLYLERYNQALHFVGSSGETHLIQLFGLTEDDSNAGYFKSDLQTDIQPDPEDHTQSVERGLWDYRDMIPVGDYLLVLRSSVTENTPYPRYSDTDRGTSIVELYNLPSRLIETSYDLNIANAMSLSVGPGNGLYVLFHDLQSDGLTLLNGIAHYQFHYDYIYLLAGDDAQTGFVRTALDKLEIVSDAI